MEDINEFKFGIQKDKNEFDNSIDQIDRNQKV
jgi:hypothetical protein